MSRQKAYTLWILASACLDIIETPTLLFKDTFGLPRIKKSSKSKHNQDLWLNSNFDLKTMEKLIFCFFLPKMASFWRKPSLSKKYGSNSILSTFSSFYPILAIYPSKFQDFVLLFKKIQVTTIVCLLPTRKLIFPFWFRFWQSPKDLVLDFST